MKTISELNLGYSDAISYKDTPKNRAFFQKIFLVDENIETLLEHDKYFLIGEKGSGKTSYALYLANNKINNTISALKLVSNTDYDKFIQMKQNKQLNLSSYVSVWKVILCLLISQELKDSLNPLFNFDDYNRLDQVIKDYYLNAFKPEIITAIDFVNDSNDIIKRMQEAYQSSTDFGNQYNQSHSFQINLSYLLSKFESVIKSLRLKNNFVLFIDGIDIRPASISQDDYIECLKGLTQAVWELNTTLFGNIAEENYTIKAVLLIRPDLIVKMDLHNLNSRINDNSVLLDWLTKYEDFKQSKLFLIACNLLAKQQDVAIEPLEAWHSYFPYKIYNYKSKMETDSPFIDFLRYSLYHPRDIAVLLREMQKVVKKNKSRSSDISFTHEDFNKAIGGYSDYLSAEIRDLLLVYYSNEDFESFLLFFNELQGRLSFDYAFFLDAFSRYIKYLEKHKIKQPGFTQSADIFLQLLYEINVICYIEEMVGGRKKEKMFWCFKERKLSKIRPMVKANANYKIHHGFASTLKLK